MVFSWLELTYSWKKKGCVGGAALTIDFNEKEALLEIYQLLVKNFAC